MLNLLRPLSLGNRGLAGALGVTAKTKARRGAGGQGRERGSEQFGSASPGSKAHLLGKEGKGSPAVWRRRRERASLRRPGRGRTLDSASPAALGAPGCSFLEKPCDLFPLPSWTPTTDPSFCDPCPNGPGVEQRSCLWPGQGSGSPVLDIQSLWIVLRPVKKEKFWGLVGGGRGRE